MKICEYGSEFDWQANEAFLCTASQTTFSGAKKFRSGRDAMKAVASWARQSYKTVLMPALCCESMVSPFTMHGITAVFYKLDAEYRADILDVQDKLSENTILLYGNYFGIAPFEETLLQDLRKQHPGVLFMEDRTQDILAEHNGFVPDVTVASIRKWIPIADGGLLWTELPIPEEGQKDFRFASLRKEAMEKKSIYLRTGETALKDSFRSMLGQAAELLDESAKPCVMTEDSRRLLDHLDFGKIYRCRQENAKALQKQLQKLPENILRCITATPAHSTLYVPVLLKEQEKLQTALAGEGIYCPVIWPVPKDAEGVCPVAEFTAKHMLGVPCDQRYTPEDMKIIGQTIVRILHEA